VNDSSWRSVFGQRGEEAIVRAYHDLTIELRCDEPTLGADPRVNDSDVN
jgi:hypothetical protein